jgi:hypothetical protein
MREIGTFTHNGREYTNGGAQIENGRAFVYHNDVQVQDWHGNVIDPRPDWGVSYRSNLGDQRRPVRFRYDGQTYSGTAYLDAGTYIRARAVKS